MTDWITRFVDDPMVAALLPVVVLSVATFALTVYRSLAAGTFDWSRLPRILDTLVLRRVVPLAILGIAAVMQPAGAVSAALTTAYLAGAAAAAVSELAQLLALARDSGVPEVPMTDLAGDGQA